MTPRVRIEILSLDDDGAECVDVIEAVDHTSEAVDDADAPASAVHSRPAPRETP